MIKNNFPFIALGLGLFLMLLVMKGSEIGSDGVTTIPLLTLLFVCEFAFVVTAIGSYLGIRGTLASGFKPFYSTVTLICILLSLSFFWQGVTLWQSAM
ncbi:MAG: hypothetical protein ABW139_16755 [Candidatus Thiodiazotropha sp. DIVDIV]